MDASTARLKSLVDECDYAPILFLAHNGPSGLGDRANSIWGCDFRRKEEDWGDRDLEEAVRYANTNGRKVLATVAGHMHRKTKSGKRRPGQVEKDGVLYVNGEVVDEPYVVNKDVVKGQPKLQIPDGYVYVMGDNRPVSGDSRVLGPIPEDRIIGKVMCVMWPISHWKTL